MMQTKTITLGIIATIGLVTIFAYMAGAFTPKLSQELLADRRAEAQGESITIAATPIPEIQAYSGQVVADQQAVLSARLTAQVAEVLIDVGDTVQQGDVLMRLESRDLDARVTQQQQAISAAQARLNEARLEFGRVEQLAAKKLVPQAQFDRAQAALKTAEASFNQANAALSEAETTFGFSIITAPFDGVISQRPINQGDQALPGTPLVSLYNPAVMKLAAFVPEKQLPLIQLGQQWPVRIDALERELAGVVTEMTPLAQSAAHSYRIKLRLDSEQPLFPGMFGRVHLTQGEQAQVLVPKSALYRIGQVEYVKRIVDGRSEPTIVRSGKVYDDRVVIRSGLRVGETVLVQH